MLAHIDSYSQINIELNKREAELLCKTGRLEGKLSTSLREKMLPLRLKVSEKGWRAEGIPWDKPLKYEIDIPLDSPKKILEGKVIGTDRPTICLRKVYISLEGISEVY